MTLDESPAKIRRDNRYNPDKQDPAGHYEILTTPTYTDVGCAFVANTVSGQDLSYYNNQGLWICDFSY